MLSPNSSGFLTLWFPLQICCLRHPCGKTRANSDLTSSGAMWPRCPAGNAVWSLEGLGDFWCFSLLVAGCWLKYNLIPRSKMTSIHPSICGAFFPLGFPVPFLFPCEECWLSNECRLVSGWTGWWLVVGTTVENADMCFFIFWVVGNFHWHGK